MTDFLPVIRSFTVRLAAARGRGGGGGGGFSQVLTEVGSAAMFTVFQCDSPLKVGRTDRITDFGRSGVGVGQYVA